MMRASTPRPRRLCSLIRNPPPAIRSALLLILILALAAPAHAQEKPAAADWDDSLYEKHTPETFAAYAPALKEIDFAKIDYQLLSAALFYETNRVRIENRKKPLAYSPALRKAAFGHAKDMAEKDFCDHVNPDDPAKRTLPQRLALVGVERCAMSENVGYVPARQYPLTDRKPGVDVVEIDPDKPPAPCTYLGFARRSLEGFMFSPGHKANILSDATPYLGCGAYYCQRQSMTSRGRKFTIDCLKSCQTFADKRGPDPAR